MRPFEFKNPPYFFWENCSMKRKMPKVGNDFSANISMYWFVYVALASLIKTTRPFLALVSKAKAAKLVRTLVDLFLDMEAGTGDEVNHVPVD